ncbi:DUF4440 domain-containing protein [Sphingomonas sp. 28-63-12]|uniref:DUF4440 domain-containing protein n=1 Tax=Sphingomonas sp. 28-63-12 TaxID=1970434 RepID=UPI000BC9B19B|nr:MAG: hypothetical protein B7Y47_03855 [Sphingomonas sp. 28-63-12]
MKIEVGQREIIDVIERFWRAMDARDTVTASTLVASDLIVIDAFAPFHWAGANSFNRWVDSLWAFCDSNDISVGQTTLRAPSRLNIAGDHGYVVSPAIMASARGNELVSQQGMVITTLRRLDGAWRIATLVWAGR